MRLGSIRFSSNPPNATLLKFQGSANLAVEQVLKRRSELLTTHALNVISVRGEAGVVAIAIERSNRRVLHLPDVCKGWKPDCTHGNHELLIALREEDSQPLFLPPRSKAPHTLIGVRRATTRRERDADAVARKPWEPAGEGVETDAGPVIEWSCIPVSHCGRVDPRCATAS